MLMSTRSRVIGFGSAGLLVVIGAVCAVVVGGETGEVLALALISLGFIAATALVFLEVGLSEDRERERERGLSTKSARGRPVQGSRRLDRPRIERTRGHRRRLK
jgi:hypothetical protein